MVEIDEKGEKFNVEDSFFFYPYYKKGDKIERKRVKSLLEIFVTYPKNRFNIIKEIIGMYKLINNQIIDLDNFLSKDNIKTDYTDVFEDFVTRLSRYEKKSNNRLFEDKEGLKDYVNYLITSTNSNITTIQKVNKFINKSSSKKT